MGGAVGGVPVDIQALMYPDLLWLTMEPKIKVVIDYTEL